MGRELQEAILDILTGVESLTVTIIRNGCDWLVYTMTSLYIKSLNMYSQFERLKETGSVWSNCDKMSSLSKGLHTLSLCCMGGCFYWISFSLMYFTVYNYEP